jgi:hypothetical protein
VSGMTGALRDRMTAVTEPQWSPLLVSGMTVAIPGLTRAERMPQWSPLLVSGMTRPARTGPARFTGRNGARSW